jgi:hypothetical protein
MGNGLHQRLSERKLRRGYRCRGQRHAATTLEEGRSQRPALAGCDQARRRETLVAFTSAKTLSPGMIFISLTERVVMIDAISPMLVSTITSLRTLSDTTLFTVPGSWFRMLWSISCEDSANETRCQRSGGRRLDSQVFKSVPRYKSGALNVSPWLRSPVS